ncbi:MAG: aminotransferase class V-fold PLP-dependent enzyme [Rhodobacteraceae bacterium]|nr:aminotransferase class V-fold PLP-dependent enzyme [Paracoccaceae bacterium]
MHASETFAAAAPQLLQFLNDRIAGADPREAIFAGKIGAKAVVRGPYGVKPLVYADYIASGRAVSPVEDIVMNEILPYYANSHTEASYCGGYMTALRREARAAVAAACNADASFAVIFTGSGATSGINRLVHLFGLDRVPADGPRALVVTGPYEHHSNILPWRESGARVVEIDECPEGGPDLAQLEQVLKDHADAPVKVGAFSAASNITGVMTDPLAVTRILRAHGAKSVWDYAGGGPYLPISMVLDGGVELDAVVASPHKFLGGPAASGVLVLRRAAVESDLPTWPGGGTVRFAAPGRHDYSAALEAREEAGTPNVVGDIRAALVFMIKDMIGTGWIARRNAELTRKGFAALADNRHVELLGPRDLPRLPFFSFRLRDGKGGYHHHQLATRILSDLHGVQARGGCSCAGPYVHRLLSIDAPASEAIRARILAGNEISKPGFIRFNLAYSLADTDIDFILSSVKGLSGDVSRFGGDYAADEARAIFRHRGRDAA